MSGYSGFNKLSTMCIPDTTPDRVKVAITTLITIARKAAAPNFDEIFSLVQQLDTEEGLAIEDKAVRNRLTKWYIQTLGIELTRIRSMARMSRGEGPGPENSIGKLVASLKRQAIVQFGMDLIDMGGIMQEADDAPMSALF